MTVTSRDPGSDIELGDMSQESLIGEYSSGPQRHSSKLLGKFRSAARKHTIPRQDALEKLLADAIDSDTQNAGSPHHLRRLQSEYRHFKELPSEWTAKKSAVSCNQLLSHWSFPPRRNTSRRDSDGNLPAAIPIDTHQTRIETTGTVSDWFKQVVSKLNTQSPGGLQLVATAEKLESDEIRNFFSFRVSTIATFRGQLTTLNLSPAWLVSFTLASCWGIEMDPQHNSHLEDALRTRPLLPPSLRSLGPSPNQTKIIWGSNDNRPGNLDPTCGANEIDLTWRHEVTSFKSDFDVYIWEQHKAWPKAEHAKVIFRPADANQDGARLLVNFTRSRTLDAFTEKRNISSPGLVGLPSWTTVDEAAVSLCCIFEVMTADTAKFLEACHDEATRMNIIGRKNPTTSKLRFLMHLEDCRKVGHTGVEHGLEVLAKLSQWIEQQQSPSSNLGTISSDPFVKIREDLEFFHAQFEQLQVDMREDMDMLRRYFQLAQDMTLFRLTMLAAIFLPLSFATSFFGMNMRASVPPEGPRGFSDWTNATTENLSPDIRNQTQAILSTIEASGQSITYSWPTFIGSSAGLVLILPLTLTIGAIIRVFVVSITNYAIYWRIFTIFWPFLGLILFLFSVWGAVFGQIGLATYEKLQPGPYDLDFGQAVDYYFGFYNLYIACNAILLLIEFSQAYRAWTNHRRPIFWTTLLLLTALCYALDMTVWEPDSFAYENCIVFNDECCSDFDQWLTRAVLRLVLIPWVFLGVDMVRRWRRRLARRRREKVA